MLLENLVEKMHACAPDFKVVGKALTGEDACQMASRLYPDLLITDIRMPVMNGLTECLLMPIDLEDLTLALGNIRNQFQIREFSHTCPLKVFLSFLA